MRLFITFEGLDGCGKTTQLNLLFDYFMKIGEKVTQVREPGGTEFSEAIRQILLNSKESINHISELFLFESARAELTEKVIIPALNRNEIVLCDRFYDSTTAYQGYGRQIEIENIKILNKMATSGLEPDITFYLSIPFEIAKERINSKKLDRMESSDIDFFNRVIAGFEEIYEKEKHRVIKIDATYNIETVHQSILSHLHNRFNI